MAVKQIWESNIDYALSEIEYKKSLLSGRSPESLYHQTLERTGNVKLAERVRHEALQEVAIRNIKVTHG